jgi:exodeoxyribonuclease VII small subunit
MTQPTFETHLKQLEGLVAKVESNQLPLEESLAAYEEGMKLVKVCQATLEKLELRMRKIVDDNGASEEM